MLLTVAGVLSALTLLPLVALVFSAFAGSKGAGSNLVQTVLPGYVANTVFLVFCVGLGTLVIGVATAWLVAMCRFPGRALFSWLLVLPLAMPGYVCAYAYTYLLQHPGPVQSMLREVMDWGPRDYWFPDIRSPGGAAFVLTMVLYPYVFLLARAAFQEQTASAVEAARTLGRGPWRAFLGVAVPLARPAIAAGVALALMETLADYGTVYHFGVDTFTTGIYRAWFTMGDRVAAVQFSLVLVSFVLLVIALERIGRGGRRYSETRAGRPLAAINLTGWHAAAAVALCTIPILFGFVVPAVTLIALGISLNADWLDPRTLRLISNTLTLAFVGATATVVVALVIAYARRISRTKVTLILSHVASFGYAVPGSVIAVGLLIPFGMFDRWFHGVMVALFSIPTGLLLTGTIAAVVFAYVVRFLAVALAGVDAGLERIAPSLDGASRTLGSGPMRTFCRIHAPLLTGGILTAFLITFVDIMKELPATLILRPFNFDTLAIRAHRLASDERLEMASVPSMFIVLVGLIPVIILSRQITRSHRARLHGERAVSDAPEAALAPVEAVGDGGSTSAPVGPARTAT